MSYHIYVEPKHFKVCYQETFETFADLGRFAILLPTGHQMAVLRPKEFLLFIDNLPPAYEKRRYLRSEEKEGSTIWSVSITKHCLDGEKDCNIVLSLVIEEGVGKVYLSDLLTEDRVKIERRDIKTLKVFFQKSLVNWFRKNLLTSPPHPREHWQCEYRPIGEYRIKEDCELCSNKIWKYHEEVACDCLHCPSGPFNSFRPSWLFNETDSD